MFKKFVKRTLALSLAVLMGLSCGLIMPAKASAVGSDLLDYYTKDEIKSVLSEIKLNDVLLEVPAAGFNPSKGNYIKIKTAIPEDAIDFGIDYTIRIFNPAGKLIYVKGLDGKKLRQYVSVTWDGKPSKNNEAKLDPAKYVPEGKYTIEVSTNLLLSDKTRIAMPDKKKVALVVSSKAPKGEAGVAAATKIPVYASNDFVNYVLSKMCEKAGVNIKMSEAEKVKKIYQWEVKNFKHVHSFEEFDKLYWDDEALSKEIEAFAKKTDKEVAEGKAIKVPLETWEYALAYQGGVCDHNAAAFKGMLLQVGVDSGTCGGYYLNRSGKKSPHAWNSAVINGELRYFDVDVEIQNLGKVQGGLYWFNKNRKESESNHEFTFEEVFK